MRQKKKLCEYKTKGSTLRSTTRWYNEGEINSKYFFNLEKRHFKRKVLCQLRQADNTILTSDHGILQMFLTKDYNEGGLKIIDINKFNQSLKVSWIKKYLDPANDGKSKFVFEDSLKKLGGRAIFSCNLHKDDIPTLGISNSFVLEVLETWAELHFTGAADITYANIGDQII